MPWASCKVQPEAGSISSDSSARAAASQTTLQNTASPRVALRQAAADVAAFVGANADDLAMLFIVSQLELQDGGDAAADLEVRVERADGDKCPRCWRTVPTITSEGICERCTTALQTTT